MAETDVNPAVLLNISDMIDLAIGTPEVGVVDFGMLQTILHCLAQQLKVLGKNVELRGSVAMLPVGRENVHTISISEYTVEADDKVPKEKKTELSRTSSVTDTILVVERKRKSETSRPTVTQTSRSPTRGPSPPLPAAMPQDLAAEKLSLVTTSKFNILENTVNDLKDRVYGSMPKNEEILEEVRSQTNLKAITDMWTSLNVSSRLEAAEAGLAKLSSLVQDIISENAGLQERIDASPSAAPSTMAPPPRVSIAPPPAPVVSTVAPPTAAPSSIAPPSTAPPTAAPSMVGGPQPSFDTLATKDDLKQLQAHLERIRMDLDNVSNTLYSAMADMQAGLGEEPVPPPPSTPPPTTVVSTTEPAPPLAPKSAPSIAGRRKSDFPRRSFSQITGNLMERINDLEKRINNCCQDIGKNDGVLQDQINSFQDQLDFLHKEVGQLRSVQSETLSPDLVKDLQGLLKLFQTVQEMQEQLKQVHETALELAAEKEDRNYHMNALLEQIELLKTIKLDREDMVEAMADKADLRMLARKVSHDQFELACDDLSRGLEHALGKLNIQEALWQQALDDIQREIETKLDKMELSPVKDFFNTKLKQLQENLKQMASLRREVEAAGTKRRLLREVNCISCDANAVMPMEPPNMIPLSRPMPGHMSMKPYLSYELDAIRKTQATNLPQRNLHDWETIDKQMNQQKQPQKARSDTGKHICNRYCGGSHTMTTAAQRVARAGHFVKQWGPDVVPLSSGLAAGDDGRLYKVVQNEAANVGPGGAVETTCTPKHPKKTESPKTPTKPVLLAAPECRCLEGAPPAK
ncbi:uncharacterized protein LOC116774765 isoform X1 [Danaus plexippus]|uniref:uncharacterized protein LOC116774765 isoform X1 n=3 Tax=Danaus plexippus TaxID=13037 RepID=UPI002AB2EB7D|nr:uncharacterized protein LOC116774765 isoform X1 [Danaus plexippus]